MKNSRSTGAEGILKKFFGILGPGLVTGASDDDPSGIATYSQAGAQFGFGLLWTCLFSFPLMAGIQEISARIGRVTGRGVAANMRRHYPGWLACVLVGLMAIANVINLGADIAAMGEVGSLLVGGHALVYAVLLALLSVLLEVFVSYKRYVRYLKWLTLSLFAYVATAFFIRIPWGEALQRTVIPPLSLEGGYLQILVAVLGTTISPYLFFWQASQEADEVQADPGQDSLKRSPRQAPWQLRRIKADTYTGMAYSNLIAFFIILTGAVTLNPRGVTTIESAAQAAQALEPVAGKADHIIFSLGIIGSGLLALPALAGACAYGIGELLRRPVGLNHEPRKAKLFNGVIAAATLLGLSMSFLPVNPFKALVWAAIINGVVAVPIMFMMMHMADNPKVMGEFRLYPRLKVLGWLATAAMTAAAVLMIVAGAGG